MLFAMGVLELNRSFVVCQGRQTVFCVLADLKD